MAKIFYDINEFRLDPQQRRVTGAIDGHPIPLPPKAFETLLYFVERRGELLEKTTLMKAVWPNIIIVEENSRRMRLFDYWQAHGPTDNCELDEGTLICSE